MQSQALAVKNNFYSTFLMLEQQSVLHCVAAQFGSEIFPVHAGNI